MRFIINRSTYNAGSEKCIALTNDRYIHQGTYYIPRSQITVLDECEDDLLIDVKDWVIGANNIPIYDLTEMKLDRGDWETIKTAKKEIDVVAILAEQMKDIHDEELLTLYKKAIEVMKAERSSK